jgi:hypothetical protein
LGEKDGSNARKGATAPELSEIYQLYVSCLHEVIAFKVLLTFALSIFLYTVPKSCVYDLWEAFNDIAEGFGLTIEEFQEIIKSALMEYLGITEKMLNVDTDSVFRVFDSDEVLILT